MLVRMCVGVQRKVRDVKFCFENQLLASLSSDATVRLWDAQLQPIRKVTCPRSRPTVQIRLRGEGEGFGGRT